MKHFAFLCTLLILVHFSTQTPKYENCPDNFTNPNSCDCCKITCSLSETGELGAIGTSCPAVICANGSKLYADNTKQYPECCETCK